jgi:hypothetical protein
MVKHILIASSITTFNWHIETFFVTGTPNLLCMQRTKLKTGKDFRHWWRLGFKTGSNCSGGAAAGPVSIVRD